MITPDPVESYQDASDRFPGIDKLDPKAMGRFAFHAAIHLPAFCDIEFYDGNIRHEIWHESLDDVAWRARSWMADSQAGRADLSRLEFAQEIQAESEKKQEVEQLVESLEEAPVEESERLVWEYLDRHGFEFEVQLAPSPMTPQGREKRVPLSSQVGKNGFYMPYKAVITDGEGVELDDRIYEFLKTEIPDHSAKEITQAELNKLKPISEQELALKRERYGSKAAMLLAFEERTSELNASASNRLGEILEIPPFVAVSTDLYEAWKNDRSLFEDMLVRIREEVLEVIPGDQKHIAAIRSSAVYSEDTDTLSGAGIYESLVVDPANISEFREAVISVFESVDSNEAKEYRSSNGIDEEKMGLLIQRYSEVESGEDVFFGHANSSGSNGNIVDVNTNEGTLLYDKNKVKDGLLTLLTRYGRNDDQLHTHPDHNTKLSKASRRVSSIPHAAVLAEQLFDRPMQVEFVNDEVVQVRPFHIEESVEQVEFPDKPPLFELSGVGSGDIELETLSYGDNSEKEGLVVFWEEYGFTIGDEVSFMRGGGRKSHRVFPKSGAVLILRPSSNGHIQTICREKGLLCVYPKLGSDYEIEKLADTFQDAEGSSRKFRVVSDGYKAGIYSLDS